MAPERADVTPLTADGVSSTGERPIRERRESTIRVCLAGPSLDILGGQAVQLDRLLQKLRQTPGIEVDFIAMNPRLPRPVRILQRIKYVRTLANSVAYLASLLRQMRRYDVVHAFSPSYWAFLLGPVPAMAVARLYGRAALLNYHSGEALDHLTNWPGTRPLARLAHRIVVPSEYLSRVFAQFGLNAETVYNFVDLEAIPYRQRMPLRPAFLSNRNLEPLYNVAGCIRAFARIQAAVPSATLTVAGFGSQRPALELLVRELGLRDVRFTGRVPPERMTDLLDACDIMLNCSVIDNMPLSLIEAQAAGVAVVSTPTGGIPEIVIDGETGLLASDDASLAAAALRLLNEPGLASRMTRAARQRCVERFSWPAVEQAWVQTYRAMTMVVRA